MAALLRIGYDKIVELIPENCRVLDLGCGDGMLLERLQKEKKVTGYGVEISEEGVSCCVERSLYCYQADIDEGLKDYKDNSFDYVILNQTIQNTKQPEYVLEESMRIGKKIIVSFPNFAYFALRMQLFIKGTMPKTETLPFEWYNSPNIHLVTIKDFRATCLDKGYRITLESHFSCREDGTNKEMAWMPNARAEYGFFLLDGENFTNDSSEYQ